MFTIKILESVLRKSLILFFDIIKGIPKVWQLEKGIALHLSCLFHRLQTVKNSYQMFKFKRINEPKSRGDCRIDLTKTEEQIYKIISKCIK